MLLDWSVQTAREREMDFTKQELEVIEDCLIVGMTSDNLYESQRVTAYGLLMRIRLQIKGNEDD